MPPARGQGPPSRDETLDQVNATASGVRFTGHATHGPVAARSRGSVTAGPPAARQPPIPAVAAPPAAFWPVAPAARTAAAT